MEKMKKGKNDQNQTEDKNRSGEDERKRMIKINNCDDEKEK
jgi:hypothetical protein